jgi:hypothetical protein
VHGLVSVGLRASLDPGPSIFQSGRVLVAVDETGREVSRWWEPDPRGLQLALVQFADLADRRRITTGGSSRLTLSLAAGVTCRDVHDEIRAFVFEEELEEGDDESPWTPRLDALAAAGIAVDPDVIGGLPFVIELDDELSAALRSHHRRW